LQGTYRTWNEFGDVNRNISFPISIKSVVKFKNFFVYPELSYSEGFYFLNGGIGFIIPINSKQKNNKK
jgi:hypothetical protein